MTTPAWVDWEYPWGRLKHNFPLLSWLSCVYIYIYIIYTWSRDYIRIYSWASVLAYLEEITLWGFIPQSASSSWFDVSSSLAIQYRDIRKHVHAQLGETWTVYWVVSPECGPSLLSHNTGARQWTLLKLWLWVLMVHSAVYRLPLIRLGATQQWRPHAHLESCMVRAETLHP